MLYFEDIRLIKWEWNGMKYGRNKQNQKPSEIKKNTYEWSMNYKNR